MNIKHIPARQRLAWFLLVGLTLVSACTAPREAGAPLLAARATSTANVVVGVTGREVTEAPPAVIPTAALENLPKLLETGQRIASDGSYDKTENEGAGRMVCRIERDSCAFWKLARYPASDILFAGSEPAPFNDEDALMHPDMILPLQLLAILVEAEWGGDVQVMVTDTYDSLLEHDAFHRNPEDKYSLHFEGLSIDFIPWPGELRYMSRLCALAHHAGFDWVHNEENHCHASVRADSLCNICSGEADE